MKIRTRLFFGFGALIFLMFALSGIGIDRLFDVKTGVDEVYANRYTKLSLAKNMRIELFNVAKHISNMLAPEGMFNPAEETDRLKAAREKAGAFYRQLAVLSKSTPEERARIEEVESAQTSFNSYIDRILPLTAAGKKQEANALRSAEGIKLQDELQRVLESLASFHEQKMNEALDNMSSTNDRMFIMTIILTVIGLLIGIGIMFWLIYTITGGLNLISSLIGSFAGGTLHSFVIDKKKNNNEVGELATAFQKVALDLEEKTERERELNRVREEQSWINSNMTKVLTILQGAGGADSLAQAFISEVVPLVGGSFGGIYLKAEENKKEVYKLAGSYAFSDGNRDQVFPLGMGLIGQSAMDRQAIRLHRLPPSYVKVASGIGDITPLALIVLPILYEDEVLGVFEVASLREFMPLEEMLLKRLADNLAISLNRVIDRSRIEELLRISQALTQELQVQSQELLTQQEELRTSNEKLAEQTRTLQRSEEQMQRQQAQLERANEEMTAKTRQLEHQIYETEQTNRQIEKTKAALERQAYELAQASKYKSEFLANMSHELRTPLNSMLILSQLLADNKDANLTPKQVEYAGTIYSAGADLLKLIDDVLDLSKVEAGKMDIHPDHTVIRDLASSLQRSFTPVAKKGGIRFRLALDDSVPDTIYTDPHRLQQIIRNLLSNAFKFTKEGSVTLDIRVTDKPEALQDAFPGSRKLLAFIVSDTGAGIPREKLDIIFEAFQQADGTTSRRHGGTGLGLSISKQLARLLGGVITAESDEGKGSSFTLYLPETRIQPVSRALEEAAAAGDLSAELRDPRDAAGSPTLAAPHADTYVQAESDGAARSAQPDVSGPSDDRDMLSSGDRVVLIIADDLSFSQLLLEMARERGFKGLIAQQGDKGLALAREFKPDAVLLDIEMAGLDGWCVLNHLKQDTETRHIPVHVISAAGESDNALRMGAVSHVSKPADKAGLEETFTSVNAFLERSIKQLLVVKDDSAERDGLLELIGGGDVEINTALTAGEALSELRSKHYDCIVLDLRLSDRSVIEFLDGMQKDEALRKTPVLIYTDGEASGEGDALIRPYAASLIMKKAGSPERLFDETALFLHRAKASLPEDKRRMIERLRSAETVFRDKRILLVDDDIRNVFALSSMLEDFNMQVTFAENGREAVEILTQNRDTFDLVLMDIMMPGMDGYEAMREIRSIPELIKLPIIAVTAKAMKEDRMKCIEAGASDYITKPINNEQLVSLLKVWLYE